MGENIDITILLHENHHPVRSRFWEMDGNNPSPGFRLEKDIMRIPQHDYVCFCIECYKSRVVSFFLYHMLLLYGARSILIVWANIFF